MTTNAPSQKTKPAQPQLPGTRPAQPILSRSLEKIVGQSSEGEENARTTALVSGLLEDALRERASDIHLDPRLEGFQVRFRIDGSIVDTCRISKADGRRIVLSCKAQASLDHGNSRVPQDGRADLAVGGRTLAVRVATAPTVLGEKLALRLLRPEIARLSLSQLGLSVPDYELLSLSIKEARGMILLSGPTGAGKTTTLYAMLHDLRNQDKAIVTVEDPVEYVMEGITQIQVNAKQGLTFAEGARGLLRLDPDVILMGEMRDPASARVAIDVADTGHLFMSSLHARDAVATVTALRNFSVLDHEIASSVDVIVAQRLVRRLCLKCRKLEPPTALEGRWLEWLGQPVPAETWHAKGCPECAMTGYTGRAGIFEVWRLKEEEADLILKHADEHTLRRRLRKQGMSSLLEDDLAKVSEGITTLAEMQALGGFGFFAPPSARN